MMESLKVNTNKRNSKNRILMRDRFNKPLDESPFLNNFQEILIDRIILNQTGKYSRKKVSDIIRNITGNNPSKVNLKIKGGLLLTCTVEAEFYILLQETAKKVFGEYTPIDEIIHELLAWFIYYYMPKNPPKGHRPYYEWKKSNQAEKFERRFKRYYKNKIPAYT